MKTKKDFEKYINSVIKKFIPVLFLERYLFRVKHGTGKPDSYFDCVFSFPYLRVVIRYSDDSFKDWKEGKDMTPFIVHEMCHPITDPLYSKATDRYVSQNEILDERENLTDLICHIALGKASE